MNRARTWIAACALALVGILNPAFAAAEWPDFSALDRLLAKHVRPGTLEGIRLNLVDYAAWGADPDHAEAVAVLARFDPARLATREERLAFWINAYNLLAVKTVLDTGVTESIKDAGSLFRPVWKRQAGIVGGRAVTLHEIEHEILRPMGEPRIHLVIVCASLSCPDLRREAYRPDRLEEQLEDHTRRFIRNPTKGLRGSGRVNVSRIFDWFEEDFGGEAGVLAFVARYLDPAAPRPTQIAGYLDYDWSLNRQPPDPPGGGP